MNKLRVTLTLLVQMSVLSSLSAKDLVCQIIESNRLPCENHEVITPDGYKLSLHRIPPRNTTNNLKPFILMHGLIGSAADFVLSGRDRSLGCMLHERGYDVWLPNARGTTYSKRHSEFDSSMPDFWNFTWHEIGYYDLPTIIDHVTNTTGHEKVHYVAHSQGSTIFLVMLSERPEYNDRIISATLLAPVAYLSNLMSPPLRIMAAQSEKIEALLNHLGLHELFPSTALNQLGGHLLCGKGVPTQSLCILVMYLSVGFSEFEMDRALKPVGIATVKTCLLTNKVTGQDIKALKTGKLDETDPNSHLKCFVKCIFNKVGTLKGSILDKDSFFRYFESRLGKENTQKYYDMCKDEVGEGDCATSFKIVRCLVRNDKHFKQIAEKKAKKNEQNNKPKTRSM